MNRVKVTDQLTVLSAQAKLLRAAAFGIIVGAAAGSVYSWRAAPLIAWDAAVLLYLYTTWRHILRYNANVVERHALREDPSRVTADLVLVIASLVSLVAVGLVLLRGTGLAATNGAALAVSAVVASWALIHTVYTLRYAELYYRGPNGGIDFGTDKPVYSDFAYLAFTLGMTFQVSDTPFKTRPFRSVGLRHALLSYLFGTVIIATTINLIGGLGH
jgi:uncharacterized membrane protein